MQVEFFPFSKRTNSTATPSSGGTTMEVYLKDGCTVLSPQIEIRDGEVNTGWNYAYIMDFGRYYYCSDWTYFRGTWTCSLTSDPLASFKSSILATRAQVLYSSSSYDLSLLDNRYATGTGYSRQVHAESFEGLRGGAQVTPQGYFALTTISKTSVWATGTCTTWFLTYQAMQQFARELIDPSVWESIQQYFADPMEAIIDCYYLPLDITSYVSLSSAQPIQVADYTFGATGQAALSTNFAIKSKRVTMAIPWGYSDFRRLSPFTELSLFVPFCGSQSLSPELLSDVEQFFIDYSVDISTGAVQAIAYIKEEVLAAYNGNIKITLPVGQTQTRVGNVIGAATGVLTAVGGAITGNPIATASGLLSAVSSVAAPARQIAMGGMGGSVLGAILGNDTALWQRFRLVCTSRDTSDTPANARSTIGNLLSKVVSLGSLSGYVKTELASVAAPAFDSEINQINMTLDGGAYLE